MLGIDGRRHGSKGVIRCFVCILAVFLPINITLGYMGGKPLDIVPSDILIILLCLGLVCLQVELSAKALRLYTLLLLLYVGVCFVSIFFRQIEGSSSGWIVIVSFLRSFRAFLLFYVGYHLKTKYPSQFEKIIPLCVLLIVFSLLFSDILFNSRFPLPRWGGEFWGNEVYGFPNSPGFTYIIYFSLLVYAVKAMNKKMLYAVGLVVISLIVFFIGSRNALISYFMLLMLFFLFRTLGVYSFLLFLFCFGVIVVSIGLIDTDITLIESKLNRMQTEGALYGRDYVWRDVMNLVAEKPILGYGFEPLTDNYANHGTAHNQYIEFLYKSGFIGSFFIVLLWALIGYYLHRASRIEPIYQYVFLSFLVCVASSLAQPNLTYSITQSIFVFLGGSACSTVMHRANESINQVRKLT